MYNIEMPIFLLFFGAIFMMILQIHSYIFGWLFTVFDCGFEKCYDRFDFLKEEKQTSTLNDNLDRTIAAYLPENEIQRGCWRTRKDIFSNFSLELVSRVMDASWIIREEMMLEKVQIQRPKS